MSFTTKQLDLEIIILSEVGQTEKDKYHKILHRCGIQNNATNELNYKIETDPRT